MRISPAYRNLNLRMMTDLFCLPEATLYADVIDTLQTQQSHISTENIATDVRTPLSLPRASRKIPLESC